MGSLAVKLAGLKLDNPTILASGIMGSDFHSIKKIAESGAGAVTIKSITKEPRGGHDNPTMVEVEGGFLNAIGYSNMGLENAKYEFQSVKDLQVPAIASVVAEDSQGFAYLAKEMSSVGFSAVEAVLSCPHTPGLGLLAGHGTPEATAEIVSEIKKECPLPVIVKLSPNSLNLGDIANAALEGGADAVNMGNSLGPGMVIDTVCAKPVLSYKVGGMSGKAIKAIAVRCVYDIFEATQGKIPIIGTGGVVSGQDAIEMLMAGASAVGVGTGVYYRGFEVFRKISEELDDYLTTQKLTSLSELVGVAHG
ncbi:MAG: dihydroorotate dehydrogenase [Candidatus Altiarchaeota archaeon]|nr:dihydroorotate dehydrogenase [Candidatus Altiarchaeota archaeon]